MLDCSTSPHPFRNACGGPLYSFSLCFLISILPPPSSFYSWLWPTHVSTVLEGGSLTRAPVQVCICSVSCVSCFLCECWQGIYILLVQLKCFHFGVSWTPVTSGFCWKWHINRLPCKTGYAHLCDSKMRSQTVLFCLCVILRSITAYHISSVQVFHY